MSVRVAAINYLNTLPFMYGIAHSSVCKQIELVACTPSRAAQMLIDGQVDLGIVPVGALENQENLKIVSDYCIGANGSVDSVLICSQKPLDEIDVLYLDEDSRTSAALTKLLAKVFWKIEPEFKPFDFHKLCSVEKIKTADKDSNISYSGEVHNIQNSLFDTNNSYLLIGDKALENKSKFKYVYDLAQQWKEFTQKPFVFATWTTNKNLSSEFLQEFNEALRYGVNHIEEAVHECFLDSGTEPADAHVFDISKGTENSLLERVSFNVDRKYSDAITSEQALKYLKNNISYEFNQEKKDGLLCFWNMVFSSSKFRVRWF